MKNILSGNHSLSNGARFSYFLFPPLLNYKQIQIQIDFATLQVWYKHLNMSLVKYMFIATECMASKKVKLSWQRSWCDGEFIVKYIYLSFLFFFFFSIVVFPPIAMQCLFNSLLVTRFVVDLVRWYGKIMQNNIGNDIMISFIIIINISNKFKCTHKHTHTHSFLLRVFFFFSFQVKRFRITYFLISVYFFFLLLLLGKNTIFFSPWSAFICQCFNYGSFIIYQQISDPISTATSGRQLANSHVIEERANIHRYTKWLARALKSFQLGLCIFVVVVVVAAW